MVHLTQTQAGGCKRQPRATLFRKWVGFGGVVVGWEGSGGWRVENEEWEGVGDRQGKETGSQQGLRFQTQTGVQGRKGRNLEQAEKSKAVQGGWGRRS